MSDCKENPIGGHCPEKKDDLTCGPFQLTKNNDTCFIDSVINESITIGGANLNVFKLLGIHEQGQLVDLTGNGNAISSGSSPGFPASNAFNKYITEWRSSQKGSHVVQSAYIGYDFGEIKLSNDRVRYGTETFVKQNIATIKLKQGGKQHNRATRIRVERSPDNKTWYGVAILTVPDSDELITLNFKHSAPARFWRIRPVDFNGSSTDVWAIAAIQMFDYDATSIDDIQDPIFMENRSRDYAPTAVTVKGTYDLLDIQTELTRMGIDIPSQMFYIQVNFSAVVAILGRPFVIGDIIEMPSETQYGPTLEPIKKYVEVTDVGWSTEGYTPGWQPTMLRLIAQPAFTSEETQDIFGGIGKTVDSMGLSGSPFEHLIQDFSISTNNVKAEANTATPERGEDIANATEFTTAQIENATRQGLNNLEKLSIKSTGVYVEDAMPPNGADYTEGDTFPESPLDGDYHRLTYTQITHDTIPPRLFRYSVIKGKWIYLESDRRLAQNATRPLLQEFLSSTTRVDNDDIGG